MSQNKPKLLVDFCDYKAAKFAVMNWHYTKKPYKIRPVINIGVWEDGYFIGSLVFGRGANKNLGTPYGLSVLEICELVRVALKNHKSSVTRIISIAIKLLKKQSPSLRAIISFADPNYGHLGVIYQAGNWLYLGKMDNTFLYKAPGGRLFHPREVSKTGWEPFFGEMREVPKSEDCIKIHTLGKHRYLYPLDKRMRRQILPLAQPYPKRADVV